MARLFRVILPVTDIRRAASFYEKVLGQSGRRVSPGRHYFDCEGGPLLACYDPRADGDDSESRPLPEPIYLEVDDLEGTFRKAVEAGAGFSSEVVPEVGPLGRIADRPWGERSFYAADPFGNPLCFVSRGTAFTGGAETSSRKDVVRPSPEPATAELREKVRSKMEVGKFFAGFITLLIGILLRADALDSLAEKAGVLFLVAALGFCIAAVFCYDRLLMPREYWTGLEKKDKTEERFQDHLREQMVRSWSWLFVPAVWCFGIGFVLMLVEALSFEPPLRPLVPEVETGLLVVLSIGAVAAPIWLGRTKGPQIYD